VQIPGKIARSASSATVRVARGAGGGSRPLCVLPEGQKTRKFTPVHESSEESRLTGQATNAVQRQFEAALQILNYWRDDASHGQQTTIAEVQAYAAISELLRLAQFTSDHWDDLTA